MFIEIIIWLLLGALSGWIGYLASRTPEKGHISIFLGIGMVGGVVGGAIAEQAELAEIPESIDAASSITALFLSAVVVILYSVIASIMRKRRAKRR